MHNLFLRTQLRHDSTHLGLTAYKVPVWPALKHPKTPRPTCRSVLLSLSPLASAVHAFFLSLSPRPQQNQHGTHAGPTQHTPPPPPAHAAQQRPSLLPGRRQVVRSSCASVVVDASRRASAAQPRASMAQPCSCMRARAVQDSKALDSRPASLPPDEPGGKRERCS